MKKIIVYDFDKTLTYKDTLLGFFRFAPIKNLFYPCKVVIYSLFMILTKIGVISNGKLKDIGIKLFLKNLDNNLLDKRFRTYRNFVKFNKVYHNLVFNIDSDYYIVSASFEDYLRPMFPDFVTVLGSKIKYEDHRSVALEFNCYKENKVKALKNLNIQRIDILYADSYSDYSLAQLANQIIIVNGDKEIVCNSLNEFKGYFGK